MKTRGEKRKRANAETMGDARRREFNRENEG